MNTRLVVTTLGASGFTVNESVAKPISRLSLEGADLTPRKSLVILVLSRELLLMGGSGADNLIQRELAGAVASAVDTEFVSALTTGLTPIPSQGATAKGARQDLRALVNSVNTGAGSRLYLLASSTIAKRLAMIGDSAGSAAFPGASASTGGVIGGVPLVISDGVGGTDLILVDAAQIAASSAAIEFDKSNSALLNLSDSPTRRRLRARSTPICGLKISPPYARPDIGVSSVWPQPRLRSLAAFSQPATARRDAMQRKTANVTMDGRIVTVPRRELELAQVIARLRREIREEFEPRIKALESRPISAVEYRGVWTANELYRAGSLTTCDGGLWVAERATHEKPGNGATAWRLCVKSGEAVERRTATSQRHDSRHHR